MATLVIARWEGKLDREALARALDGGAAPLAGEPDPAAGPGDDRTLTDD